MVKKILVLAPLYPPHVGGLESHAQQWNEQLANRGYHITVATPLVTPNTETTETPLSNLTVHRFPAWQIVTNYPIPKPWKSDFQGLIATVRGQSPDLIVSRTRFFLTSLLARRVARQTNTPWLHIEHGSDFVQSTNRIIAGAARLYDESAGRLALRSADRIVANSRASAQFVQKLAPTQKPTVIYRGVDQTKLNAITPNPQIRPAAGNQTVIVFNGRLISGKGIQDLLTAAYHLPPTTYRLFIIGDGPERNALQKKSRSLGLQKQITFTGQLPWEQVISTLKVADIVVNPSYSEGLPSAIIEAALCAKAIVATNVGGTPEIITNQHSGYLIPPRQPDVLASRLKQLIDHPQLRTRLGQAAHAQNQNRFNWDTSIAQYETIFKKLWQPSASYTS